MARATIVWWGGEQWWEVSEALAGRSGGLEMSHRCRWVSGAVAKHELPGCPDMCCA